MRLVVTEKAIVLLAAVDETIERTGVLFLSGL